MTYDDGVFTINSEKYSLDPNHYNGSDVTYTKNSSGKDCVKIKLDAPTYTDLVTTHTAVKAYQKVMAYAGASLIRDEVDERYMTEAKNGTATYKGSVTKKAGRIDLVSDVKGYTEANFGTGSREAGYDTDKDGMPDAWETANGLNPNSASDANTKTLDPCGWYTNLEVFLNSVVQDIMISENQDATESVNDYYPAYTKEDGTKVAAVNPETTAIRSIVGDAGSASIVKTEYFSLQGTRLSQPTGHIYIEVNHLSDGSKRTFKRLNR